MTTETVGGGLCHVHGLVRIFKVTATKSFQTSIVKIQRNKWGFQLMIKYDKTPIRDDEFPVNLGSSVPMELLSTLTRNKGQDYTYRYRKYVLKSNDSRPG